jgi:hypothetical protein
MEKEDTTKQDSLDMTKFEDKVVVGLMVSAEERYYDALQAQGETWLKSIPSSRVFVVGPKDESGSRPDLPRFIPSPCVDRNLWCKRLQQIVEAHRILTSGISFDWLLSGNEDWYVNVPAILDTLKDKSPLDAIVYSSLGCGQHWEYHKNSKGGILPRPKSWPNRQQCDALSQRGGICGGSGIVLSRRAVEVLMKDGGTALFNRTHALPFDWKSYPQDDDVLSCIIYELDGQVQLELFTWQEGARQGSFIKDCPTCHVTTVHAVQFNSMTAANILRKAHTLINKNVSW